MNTKHLLANSGPWGIFRSGSENYREHGMMFPGKHTFGKKEGTSNMMNQEDSWAFKPEKGKTQKSFS